MVTVYESLSLMIGFATLIVVAVVISLTKKK
ncbi:putative holin-like toxin [Bacillus sp. JJ1521]